MIDKICRDYDVNTEQAEALDIKINTGLKAGAGSGKTRVLAKRFFKILKEAPLIDIDSIVAITFTRKAAVEMKERIRLEIYREIKKEHDRDLKLKWKKLRDLITTANIDTIHGFCTSVIRDNFASAGIDPAFTLIEEADSAVKLQEFTEEAITEYLENTANDSKVNHVLDKYGTVTLVSGNLRDDIIRLYFSIRGHGDFEKEMEKWKDSSCNELTSMAVSLLINLHEKYKDFKNKNNVLDFNDLEIMTEKLLENHGIKERYFQRFRYFLVDEFQDVNPIQERILSGLTEQNGIIPPGRLFIVGDRKQSIYGFRGANYKIFDTVCEKIDKNGTVKYLSNCYRSTANIVDTVNMIFEKLIDPFEKLHLPFTDKGEELKVQLVTWKRDELSRKSKWDTIKKLLPDDKHKEILKREFQLTGEDEGNSHDKKDYQGAIVAGIVEKLTGEYRDEKGGFTCKDIAILLRSRTNLKSIEHAMRVRNIPCCVIGGLGFWEKDEIIDIMSLYKYIFNPSDSISFLSVLRSPLMGFSDDMIFTLLEGYDGTKPLMSYLKDLSESSPVAMRAYNLFTKCLKLKGTLNSYELIKRLCDETNYGEILLSLQEGEQKYRNLEKLFSLVMDFERKNIYNPGELPMYLELMEDHGGMNEEAFIDTEDSDSVKIMTVHASKGLEFDAVIIPDMDRKIDWIVRRDKPLFFYDEEKGIISTGVKDEENPDYQAFYERQILKENNDSRRIFYVAATRAKRYLAFVGENQESPEKDEPSLNTFMIQMKWALKDRIVSTMEHTDGKSFISSPPLPSYPPDFATEAIKELKKKGYDGEIIKPYESPPTGSINISMYQKYLTCPRLYYFQYLARLEPDHTELQEEDLYGDKKTDARLRGNVVHEILSHLNSLSDRDMNEKIEKLIKEEVSKHKEDYISEDEIRKYIVNYFDIEKNLRKERKGKYLKSFYEFRFSVPLYGNILLNGIADRVDLYENNGQIEVFIIEYKTDTVRNINDIKEKIDFYRKQLYSYMYALGKMTFREAFKTEVKKSYIYILQRGLYEEIEKDDRGIEELGEELVKSSGLLLGREDFNEYKCNVSGMCPMCDYKTLCDRLRFIGAPGALVKD